MKVYSNYINGSFVPSTSPKTFVSSNPANQNDILGTFPITSSKEVNEAVRSARAAFEPWNQLSRVNRADYFEKFFILMEQQKEELARLVSRECGKPLNEGRADVIEAIHMMQYTYGTARQPHGFVVTSEIPEKEGYILRKPIGVMAAFSPWNFPIAIPLWLTGIALLEGNTLVFKPSSETPLCGYKLAELFQQAGFPPGVINVIFGSGSVTGEALIQHDDVDFILFTGSAEVGNHIKEVCATSHGTKDCACEMGGKNAVIVCEDADLGLAVNACLLSAFKTAGQRCVSASRLIVHESLLEKFEQKLVAMSQRMTIGDPFDENTFMGPVINEASVKKILRYNDLAQQEVAKMKKLGAKVLLEGKRLSGAKYGQGYFLAPMIYRLPWYKESRVLVEEVFGPHVAIIPYRTIEQAIDIYNATPYGLALAVITENYRTARCIRQKCEFGVGYHNLPSIGAEVHLPFGGVKQSGNGKPSACALIEAVTHKVAWTVNHAKEIKLAQGLSSQIK